MRTRPRQDPHLVLGVKPGASRAEIRRAYRRRAMATHPDVAGTHATADMAALNDARDTLVARAGRPSDVPGDADADAPGSTAAGPVVPDEPAWPPEQQTVWPDYWSAWNDLPRRP